MRDVFIGVDTGHCTGWGIVVREDDGSLNLFGAGVVPIVSERDKTRKVIEFWAEVLERFKGDRIYICTELNLGVGFATSAFFVQDQRLSPMIIKIIDQRMGNPKYEFLELSPTVIGRLFGVRNILGKDKVQKEVKKKGIVVKTTNRRPVMKSIREQLRDRVVQMFDLDEGALSKCLDAWDSLAVAVAGYYIKYGVGGDFSMHIAKCLCCETKFILGKAWVACACGNILARKENNKKVEVKAINRKNVAVIAIPFDAFCGKADTIEKITDFDFEKLG